MKNFILTDGDSELPIRLIGGPTPKSGLIQLFYLNQWVALCDENWSEAEAEVACRQLGLEGRSMPTVRTVTWQLDDPIFWTSFHCWGDEENLASCTSESSSHQFSHICFRTVGVVCQKSGKVASKIGLLFNSNLMLQQPNLEKYQIHVVKCTFAEICVPVQ